MDSRKGLHDVKPEEVLRTFTDSVEQSKKSQEILMTEEMMKISPIRNKEKQKNMVSEIQKIAKEIKRIPTEDFRTEEFL